jgi:hypothetical protein
LPLERSRPVWAGGLSSHTIAARHRPFGKKNLNHAERTVVSRTADGTGVRAADLTGAPARLITEYQWLQGVATQTRKRMIQINLALD